MNPPSLVGRSLVLSLSAIGRALAALACLVPFAADALDSDVIGVAPFVQERYDSNLFRLPDGVQPFGSGRRSAYTRSIGIGLRVGKDIGLQRFDIDLGVVRDQYDPYDFLDATSRSWTARWRWTLTSAITGNLSIARQQVPNNFSDTGLTTQSNLRKTEDRRFDVNLIAGAALHPRASVLQSIDNSEQQTLNRQNSKTTSLEGALVYDFRSGNEATTYFRQGRGDYLDINADPTLQNDAQYTEREVGLSARYVATGVTSFDGRLGYLSRHHRTYAVRDFSGLIGGLTAMYATTGKTQLELAASRSFGSAQSDVSSYSIDETITFTPVWFATQKVTIRPSIAFTRRHFEGALIRVSNDLEMTMRNISVQIDWNVVRSLTVTLVGTNENRWSNNATYQYKNNGAAIRASLRF